MDCRLRGHNFTNKPDLHAVITRLVLDRAKIPMCWIYKDGGIELGYHTWDKQNGPATP